MSEQQHSYPPTGRPSGDEQPSAPTPDVEAQRQCQCNPESPDDKTLLIAQDCEHDRDLFHILLFRLTSPSKIHFLQL